MVNLIVRKTPSTINIDDYSIELEKYLKKNIQCFFKLTERE
jgi:hypothetical protein